MLRDAAHGGPQHEVGSLYQRITSCRGGPHRDAAGGGSSGQAGRLEAWAIGIDQNFRVSLRRNHARIHISPVRIGEGKNLCNVSPSRAYATDYGGSLCHRKICRSCIGQAAFSWPSLWCSRSLATRWGGLARCRVRHKRTRPIVEGACNAGGTLASGAFFIRAPILVAAFPGVPPVVGIEAI